MAGTSPVIHVQTTSTFLVNDFNWDDRDTLQVHGSTDGETITVDTTPGSAVVQVGGLLPVNFTVTLIESLRVFGEAGNDTFNVTPGGIPIFIDGGDPIGTTPGDLLNVISGGGVLVEPGPENDEGGVITGGNARISYDHIEALSVQNPLPDAGCA